MKILIENLPRSIGIYVFRVVFGNHGWIQKSACETLPKLRLPNGVLLFVWVSNIIKWLEVAVRAV